MAEDVIGIRLGVTDAGTPVIQKFVGEVKKSGQEMAGKVAQGARTLESRLAALVKNGFDRAYKKAGDFDQRLNKLDSSFTSGIKKVGAFAGAIAGISFGAATITAGLSALSSFEDELANVSTLIKGDATEAVAKLRQEIIALPPELGTTTELTKGLYNALSAGVEPARAVAFVGDAAKLAKAGLTSMDTATNILTASMDAFGFSAGEAGHVSDVLFTAVRLGKTTMDQLGSSISTVFPLAKTLGVSFEDTTAIVTTLTKTFPTTSEAVTGLKGAFDSMIQNADKFREAGVDILGILKKDGIIGALDALKNITGGNIEEIAKFITSMEGQTAILSLMGSQYGTLKTNMEEFTKTAGATTEAHEKNQQRFKAAMETFTNAIERLVQTHGPGLLAFLTKVAHVLTENLPAAVGAFKATWADLNTFFNKTVSFMAGALASYIGIYEKAARFLGLEGIANKLKQAEDAIRGVQQGFGELADEWSDKKGKIMTGAEEVKTSVEGIGKATGKTAEQVRSDAPKMQEELNKLADSSDNWRSRLELVNGVWVQTGGTIKDTSALTEASGKKMEEALDAVGKKGKEVANSLKSDMGDAADDMAERMTETSKIIQQHFDAIAARNKRIDDELAAKKKEEIDRATKQAEADKAKGDGLFGDSQWGSWGTTRWATDRAGLEKQLKDAYAMKANARDYIGTRGLREHQRAEADKMIAAIREKLEPFMTEADRNKSQLDIIFNRPSTQYLKEQQRLENEARNQQLAQATSGRSRQSALSAGGGFTGGGSSLVMGGYKTEAYGDLGMAGGYMSPNIEQGLYGIRRESNAAGVMRTQGGMVLRPGDGEMLLSRDMAESLRQIARQTTSPGGGNVNMGGLKIEVNLNGLDPRTLDARKLAYALAPEIRELIRRKEITV